MFKIMIIEDDRSLATLIKESLEKYNYEVCIQKSLRNLEEEFKELKPDLVLLDVNLPYYDGFYICRAFRRESKVPVIFISARSSDMDQIMAMEIGGDDYLVKPFNLEILMAKVKAALRRVYGEYSTTTAARVQVNSFYIDEERFRICYKGQSEELTKTEFKLMLEQIISNAIKYSKEDGKSKKLYIDIKESGEKTLLSIKDEGIGIPSFDLNRFFEPFFTGENGRAHQDSTGIGLYISSEIVKRLGHKLEIKSEPKKGTEVVVEYITKL